MISAIRRVLESEYFCPAKDGFEQAALPEERKQLRRRAACLSGVDLARDDRRREVRRAKKYIHVQRGTRIVSRKHDVRM